MKKGIWKLILGILLLIGSFSLIGDGSTDSIFGFVVGIALIAWWYLSNKKAKAAEDAKTYKFKVVGVTFSNDDGSSRQDALKEIYDNGKTALAEFQPYTFQGEFSLYVLANGNCVGSISADQTAKVNELIKAGRLSNLSVDKFKGYDGEIIYYASVLFGEVSQ